MRSAARNMRTTPRAAWEHIERATPGPQEAEATMLEVREATGLSHDFPARSSGADSAKR